MRLFTSMISLALLAFPLAAAAAPSFDDLAGGAERVESLAAFLETYVGECRDPGERTLCQRNAEAHRSKVTGHLMRVRLPDRHSRMIQVAEELPDGRVRLVLTPLFDGAGYGLSHGKPMGGDPQGRPRMRVVPFEVSLPAGMSPRRLELAIRTGNLRLDLLFQPQGTWRLGAGAQGVAARFRGLRLTSARTGKVVGEVIW